MIRPEQTVWAGSAIVTGDDGLRRCAGVRVMSITGVFDAVFVNQLFGTTERGETVFYPHGKGATGYLVPPEREPGLRAGLRWLTFFALFGSYALVALILRVIESWLGFVLPLPWFIGILLVAVVAMIGAIITFLRRSAAGLVPVSARG